MRSLKCNLYNLSSSGRLVDYESAWKFQKALAERAYQYHKQGSEPVDSILLVQHPSVYTLGRGATPDNIKFKVTLNSPHKVVRVERGGEVTWHGPGQLVAYPILNLNYHKRDLHWLTSQLEETVIQTLLGFGISGERSAVNTGVWVGKNKISAVGLTASRWITMHGIALNVNCDLTNFENIIPCGLTQSDRGVCSIQGLHNTLAGHLTGESFAFEDESQISGADDVDIAAVADRWVHNFGDVFNMNMLNAATKESYSESASLSVDVYKKREDLCLVELNALVDSYPAIAELVVPRYLSELEE